MSRVGIVLGFFAAGCAVETTADLMQSSGVVPITVSPRVSAISEAGDTAFFTVALGTRPSDAVLIDIRIDPASEARAEPASLVFVPNDWAPRSFQIVAIDDVVFDGDISLAVELDVSSSDPHFSSYQPPLLDLLGIDDDYVVTGYRMRRLFPGSEGANPAHLNNRGQAVADVRYPGNTLHAYIWDNDVITDLGDPTRANDINDAGVVVGFLDDITRSFRYENGRITSIPGEAWGINDRGHIVGDALYVNGQRSELRGGQPVTGLAINNRDHVAGLFPTPPFHERAFFWNGQFVDLGSFGGPLAAGWSINEHDQVVGFMWDRQIRYHAFYYDGGAIIDLGTATGNVGAAATAINNRGDIAGYDHDGGLPAQGWVGRVGKLTTIQSMLVDGSCFFAIEVLDINDRGQILGRGFECNVGSPHAYVFEPVKAPRSAP